MKLTTAIFAATAATLALAACSGAPEEQRSEETNVAAPAEPLNTTELPAAEAPAPLPTTNQASVEAPPEDLLSADEQTQEDADATGMTAKVNRDEGGNSAGQPAQ